MYWRSNMTLKKGGGGQNHLLQIDSMSHCVQWLPVPPSNCKKKENHRGNNLLDLSSIQQKCLLNSWRLIKYWKCLPCNWNLKKCQNYFLQNESDVKERSRLSVLWGILSSFISCIMLAFWSLNIVYVMSLYNLVYKLLCVQLRPWTVHIRFHSGHVHGQTLKQRYSDCIYFGHLSYWFDYRVQFDSLM